MTTTPRQETICLQAIGHVRSPHTDIEGMPIQPTGARGIAGSVLMLPQYAPGLQDLDGFSRIILLYHLHRVRGESLKVTPFLDTRERGIFATRSPRRPNAIGLSVLELAGVDGREVHLRNVDILDGTPVLDIKPYVPDFDVWPAERIGWFEGKSGNAAGHRSDARFREADTLEPQGD